MRIACLQFAPQVGDVNNNLNRADAVLAKANPEDFEDLDLIVLPELAFTGPSFQITLDQDPSLNTNMLIFEKVIISSRSMRYLHFSNLRALVSVHYGPERLLSSTIPMLSLATPRESMSRPNGPQDRNATAQPSL